MPKAADPPDGNTLSLNEPAPARWEPAGVPAPTALVAARIELHWAVQPIAAAARALIAPAADDSHTSLIWLPRARVLAGGLTPGGLRVALSLEDLTLIVLDATGERAGDTLALGGRTLDEALGWTTTALRAPKGTALERPAYAMPAHDVAAGGMFGGDGGGTGEARAELGRWFATAHALLEAIAATTAGASPVRCWPHHFDLATLLHGAEPRTIGVGLSPGDGSYAEPYWYVTPWPYPTAPALPELPAGARWHREGWLGAVLTGTENLAAAITPGDRSVAALGFIRAAVAACEVLLRGGSGPA